LKNSQSSLASMVSPAEDLGPATLVRKPVNAYGEEGEGEAVVVAVLSASRTRSVAEPVGVLVVRVVAGARGATAEATVERASECSA